jgi:hypothetical protein
MATKPLHKYTVAEAGNLQVYENYSSVTITVDDDDTDNNGTDWLTSGDGQAKEVTFIPISGTNGDTVKVALKINGSWGDDITVKFDDFPITINNLLIDQVRIESSSGTSTAEVFEVLSFH